MGQIRVLLVDDLQLFVDGCKAVLETEPDIQVVGTATNGEEALEVAQRERPDIVVMDIEMPPGMDGVTATRCLRARDPECRVILLSGWNRREYIAEGIKAGVVGYVLKDTARTNLVQAIRDAARGEHVVHPRVLPNLFGIVNDAIQVHEQHTVPSLSLVTLTDRERNILHLMNEGVPNEKIMNHLGMPEGTFRSSKQRLFAKLGVHSRQQALDEARRRGVL